MEPTIRVLCVMSTLDRGGAESMLMNLYRNIDKEKVQFDFVKHCSLRGKFEDEIENSGGRIYIAPRYYIYNHFPYVRWWKKFLKEHPEYRIIHGHFFTISSIYFKIARQLNIYTIGHSHCTKGDNKDFIFPKLKTFFKYLFVKKIEKYSDYCFACSQEAGKWIFKNKPFTVLNNAIDSKEFVYNSTARKEVRDEFGYKDELVLGTVGRIMHQKNPEGIISIFEAAHKKNSNTRLLWVGNGPEAAKAKNILSAKGLLSSVIFTGVRSDVNRLLQAMDVFIFPSHYEGLGVVAIEAQAAGLPTLCSDVVPREAGITSLCHFLPLGEWDVWANECLKPLPERQNMRQQIIDVGYDIHTTAKFLQEFYYEHGRLD